MADETKLKIEDLIVGTGAEARSGQTVTVHYTGWLTNGQKFDSSVDRPHQGTGLGRHLVRRLEEDLVRRGVGEVILHSRDHAVGFYERLGYRCYGEPFFEVGIPHRSMRRTIAEEP